VTANDYLPKEGENRLGQAIKLANAIRSDVTFLTAVEVIRHLAETRRTLEEYAGTGPRSEATWQMAIKIATEVK